MQLIVMAVLVSGKCNVRFSNITIITIFIVWHLDLKQHYLTFYSTIRSSKIITIMTVGSL